MVVPWPLLIPRFDNKLMLILRPNYITIQFHRHIEFLLLNCSAGCSLTLSHKTACIQMRCRILRCIIKSLRQHQLWATLKNFEIEADNKYSRQFIWRVKGKCRLRLYFFLEGMDRDKIYISMDETQFLVHDIKLKSRFVFYQLKYMYQHSLIYMVVCYNQTRI